MPQGDGTDWGQSAQRLRDLQEKQRESEKMAALTLEVRTGFAELRSELKHMARNYALLTILGSVGTVAGIGAFFQSQENRTAISENRAALLRLSEQVYKNKRDIENMMPLVFSLPTPSTPEGGK